MAFYLVDKKSGVTSQDVVTKVKKNVGANKAGHGGTLDPFATGLLVVATDGHTKLLNKLLNERKTYSGVIKFGQTTETLDPEFPISETKEINFNEKEVKSKINKKFIGVIKQRPPRFSSIKVNGVKAYKRAREGEIFELAPVKREIYRFDIKQINTSEYSFKVEVSSGTYIRSLAADLAESLGTVGMLTELRREKIGTLTLEKAGSEDKPISSTPYQAILIEELLINEQQMKMLLQGKTVKITLDRERSEFIAISDKHEI